jgi:hypothetical protein
MASEATINTPLKMHIKVKSNTELSSKLFNFFKNFPNLLLLFDQIIINEENYF